MSESLLLVLDSASVDDAAAAARLGIVSAITTNPTLLAKEGGPARERITALLDAFPGLVFFQPLSVDPEEVRAELAWFSAQPRVIPKLPAVPDMYAVAAEIASDGGRCAFTAVYSPAQALAAAAASARWIIPYVNRAKRLLADGEGLIVRIAGALARVPDAPAILAASIKSPDEAVEAIFAGADAISAPLKILVSLMDHPLTASAVADFLADASSLTDAKRSGGPQGQ